MNINISFKFKNFVKIQFIAVTSLVILGFLYYYFSVNGPEYLILLFKKFDVGREQGIPTYFSAINLILSSILMFAVYLKVRIESVNAAKYWLILSIVFFVLSIDESISIHEKFTAVQVYLQKSGISPHLLDTHQWLPFGVLFVLIMMVVFIPILKSLSKESAIYFMIAGIVFISGAMGLEFLGAMMLKMHIVESRGDWLYLMKKLVEEGFEMYGIAILNCALYREMLEKKIIITFN